MRGLHIQAYIEMRDIEAHIKVKYQSDDKRNEMWANKYLSSYILIKIFICINDYM